MDPGEGVRAALSRKRAAQPYSKKPGPNASGKPVGSRPETVRHTATQCTIIAPLRIQFVGIIRTIKARSLARRGRNCGGTWIKANEPHEMAGMITPKAGGAWQAQSYYLHRCFGTPGSYTCLRLIHGRR